MTGSQWLVVAIAAGVLWLPAWSGVRCLIQARRLLRWRRPSLKGLDGQPVALRGEVRVSDPMKPRTIGDCLWHREVVRQHIVGSKSSSMKTLSDTSHKAEFSIVIEGHECVIADLPTQVYGAHYRRSSSGDRYIHTHWLPVVDHLTVLGRVRLRGSKWEIVKDPAVGLIYSIHPAEATAFRELVKAGLCLGLVAAGVLAFYYILTGVP
jgi:hypothetical protein